MKWLTENAAARHALTALGVLLLTGLGVPSGVVSAVGGLVDALVNSMS